MAGRVWIDRLSERKPLFGNVTHEVYRGDLPMAAVRYTAAGEDGGDEPAGAIAGVQPTPAGATGREASL